MDYGEWELKEIPLKKVTESFFGTEYPTLVYTIHLKRKSMYYVVNIIMPCVFITICGLFVFLLPPDSGEKVSLAVTILLSSTVFLLYVADSMPPQSSVVPVLGEFELISFLHYIYI